MALERIFSRQIDKFYAFIKLFSVQTVKKCRFMIAIRTDSRSNRNPELTGSKT